MTITARFHLANETINITDKMPTIGFSNKNNMWTSRYSYLTSCMAAINKTFLSSPADPSYNGTKGSPIWKHNLGDYNKFYGFPVPSMFSATFSQNPSQNKLMKSASIEGSRNTVNAISIIKTQDELDANGTNSVVQIGASREVNGTTYLGLDKSPRLVQGKNVQMLGRINITGTTVSPGASAFTGIAANSATAVPNHVQIQLDDGYVNNSLVCSDEKPAYYVVYVVQSLNGVSGGLGYAFSLTQATTATFNPPASDPYGFLLNNDFTGTTMPEAASTPNYDHVNNRFNVYTDTADPFVVAATAAQNIEAQVRLINDSGIAGSMAEAYLGAVYHPDLAGDDVRSQTAEVAVMMPSNSGYFEVYALNLNYEPLPMSHDK